MTSISVAKKILRDNRRNKPVACRAVRDRTRRLMVDYIFSNIFNVGLPFLVLERFLFPVLSFGGISYKFVIKDKRKSRMLQASRFFVALFDP